MKLKLTHSEFMCLHGILKNPIYFFRDYGGDMYEALISTIILSIYQKFYVRAFIKKKMYSIKLSPQEAIAFWLFFNDHEFDNASFEGNLLNKINNSIHQQTQIT